MINPIPTPDVQDPSVNDPDTAAAWREREQRQRSVRLLMMFLLMLLLMDGEEQSSRRRNSDPNYSLRKRSKVSKKNTLLDEDVFEARREQEDRLIKVSRSHPRFISLMDLNDKINHDAAIRKWADQQQQHQRQGKEDLPSNDNQKKQVDPDEEKMIWHYPWNSTGFYRGEWFRDHAHDEEQESENGKGLLEETTSTRELTTIELEAPMTGRLAEMRETVGVFLLPSGTKVKPLNTSRADQDTGISEASSKLRTPDKTQSSWISGVGQPELNEVLAKAEEDSVPFEVTLTKEHGRAAFQFYSRSIPAMKELSLVDGFIKLYDSNTVGYSTRRDMLLRVRGVLIHSIGRLSLVSNAPTDRSALIISDRLESDSNMAHPSIGGVTMTDHLDEKIKRRRLSEMLDVVGPGLEKNHIDQIRADALDLFDFDALDVRDAQNWDLLQMSYWRFPTFSRFDDSGWLFDVLNRLWEPSTKGYSHRGRRLSDVVITESSSPQESGSGMFDHPLLYQNESLNDTSEQVESGKSLSDVIDSQSSSQMTAGANSSASLDREDKAEFHVVHNVNLTANERRRLKKNENETSVIQSEGNGLSLSARSKIVIPFPYVADDKMETVRKTKTAAGRRMPAREQMLEANAGRCEFEINLDVKEVEWTLGQWKALMAHSVLDSRVLDPKLHLKELEDGEGEEDEDGSQGTHLKTKHAESSLTRRNEREKTFGKPTQALAMVMSGSIVSPNCNFHSALNATAIRTDWENTTGKAINYSFYMMLTCLAQIVVLLRQLLHTQHQSAATRVSLTCIGWQAVLDALLCLGHIYLSLAIQPLFTAFASVAFFKLLIFCVIEMKYMAIIIQARNNANGGHSTTDMLRRQVAVLHVRFYIALVGAFLAFFYAGQQYRTIYMLALYSFWVPQIILNVITEAKHPLHKNFIYGMSISRCVVPIYMFAVKDNFLKEVYPDSPTNYVMVEMLALWIGFQAAVLIAQGKYGARFMIPARFLPPKFDYHRMVPASMIPEDTEQSLAKDRTQPLGSLNAEPSEACKSTGTRNRLKGGRGKAEPLSTTMTAETITPPPTSTLDCVICCNGINHRNRKGYMLAPCEHIFHKDCLIQWMDVKMECPICRTELPAI